LQEEVCEGVILRMKDLREADLLVSMYTRTQGHMTFRAPGGRTSKRRFAGLLQSFSKHEVAFRRTRSAFPILLRLEPLAMHTELHADLHAFAAVSYAGELILRLTQEADVNPPLFELLDTFITYCHKHSPLSEKALCRFHTRLLQLLGLQPGLARCLECGRNIEQERRIFFDLSQGGMLCDTCPPSHPHRIAPLSQDVRGLLICLQRRQATDFAPHVWYKTIELFDLRMTHLLGQPPKSRDFLKQLVGF
tara:strand:+ start:34381 stop:35127 length:747 start_codon:yes stop_codon:yes gene_type:complete